MIKPEFAGQFKKDYKPAVKRGCRPEKLEEVVTLLCEEKPLPKKYRDHQLRNSRNYKGMRECHIEPDWLLIYRIEAERLILGALRQIFQASSRLQERISTACPDASTAIMPGSASKAKAASIHEIHF